MSAFFDVTVTSAPRNARKADEQWSSHESIRFARSSVTCDVIAVAVNQQAFISNGGLLNNDYDPEGDPLSISSLDTTGLAGTLTCDSFGRTGDGTDEHSSHNGHHRLHDGD